MRSLRFLFFLLLSSVQMTAVAQDSLNVSMLGWLHNYWDLAYETEIVGSYAYCVTRYTGLRILDISDPLNPMEVGSLETPASAFGIAVAGNYAYVADESSGLRIIDITDPTNPYEVGYYNTPGSALGVAISGNIAYVADGLSGLRLLNITDPAHPTSMNVIDTFGYARSVRLAGSLAYVSDDSDGLRIIDISDPMHLTEAGFYNSPGYTQKSFIEDEYAYLADREAGLRIVDISNPAAPFEVGFFDTPDYTYGVEVRDHLAYLADGDQSLRIIDVSNPAAPFEVAHRNTSGNSQDVCLYGNYAILSDKYAGMQIIDISISSSPVFVSVYDTPGHCLDAAVSGSYVYIADVHDGVQVIDISDPANPVEVGRCQTAGWVLDVVVSGNYAYLADAYGTVDVYGGLRVIDITSPTAPYQVGFYDSPGDAYAVAIAGNLVYLADGPAGLRIVNVSNPALPVEIGYLDTPGWATDVDVFGDFAYVADSLSGLRIINISQPDNPVEVGVFDGISLVKHVAARENYVFITNGLAGHRDATAVYAIDVSDPANPLLAGSYTTPGNAREIVLLGTFAYIADHWAGLLVLDISDPTDITEAGHSRNVGGAAYGVAADGCYAYLADYRYFEIFDCSEAVGCPVLLPEIQSVVINEGALITDERVVSVAITAINSPAEMILSEDPAFSGASWQNFVSPTSFNLSDGNGVKTVYVMVRNTAGVSSPVSDDIEYFTDPVSDMCIRVDQGTGSVYLTWNPVVNAESYNIYAASNSNVIADVSTLIFETEDTFYVDPSSLSLHDSRFYMVTSSSQPVEPDEMVWIPSGWFTLGNNQTGTDAQEHEVYLDGYFIDAYEVTNAQYRAFCNMTGYPCYLDEYYDDYPNYPLLGVRWDEACSYCEWKGGRLPTEAEWERAAKGNEDNRLWPWGNDFDQEISGTTNHANIEGTADGWENTAPVGSFPTGISPAGCYDMAGNVYEHCWDYYSPDYYSMSPDSNPRGPETGTTRVRRGGAYHYDADFARCSNRYWLVEGYRGSCSFRCVKTP